MNGPPLPPQHQQQRKKIQENVPSLLLADHENNTLFGLLGRKCITLATGVVQVYLAQNNNSSWQKRCTGVCCFVKDNPKRSYFIRVYSIKKGELIWEQELYNQFKYSAPRPYFHTFDADRCRAGLNFANEKEAQKFKSVLEEKIRQKQDKRHAKVNRTQSMRSPTSPLPPPPSANTPSHQQQHAQMNAPHLQPPMHSIQAPTPVAAQMESKKSKKKKGKKAKLSKADISNPSGFQHVGHVGWDPNKGFDTNNMDPDVKDLFHTAGVTETDMLDTDKAQFIYDFIEKRGGIDAVKEEQKKAREAPPPPPPSRGGPPPPPSRGGPPPPPHRASNSRAPPPPQRQHFGGRDEPPPPPPSSRVNPPRVGAPPPPRSHAPAPVHHNPPASIPSSAAPPPPPPPPAAPPAPGPGAPAPPPPPPAPGGGSLLSQIQQGHQLKSAGDRPAPAPSGDGGGRNALLEAIRQGKDLKAVSEKVDDKPPPASAGGGGSLANALAEALSKRENAIHTDSESDSDQEFDDDDWSD